ncbi:MAG: aminotransferase class III-fold pyridoxal phosphate-dependent enzyme [Acidobacteria bacterium]|nr:aminotransferase class III-fold pyridoxal phosphate-dependent enzyme [Acidobacteriota bacterium]
MTLAARQEQLLRRTFLDYQSTDDFLEYPVIFNRGEGLYLWDTSGKRYFDAIGGIFVAVLGHRHPRVMEAIRAQLDRLTFAPPLHGISDVTLDFVEKLGALTPGTLRYVKPFSGGSEAVESALKFVRQYWKQSGHQGKYKVISRYHAYHGATFGAMAASGTGTRRTPFEPQMPGFLKVMPPSAYRDRFATWEEANRFAARAFEDVIVNEDPATVAAVIVEPVGNTGGVITPTREYSQILRDACTRHDVLLIFDEVITGFAKTGAMFAAQTYGVTPDLICAGKGISSGTIPTGAMIAREDLAEAFRGPGSEGRNFAHGHTFAGSPLACAAANAVMDELVEGDYAGKAQRLGAYLFQRLSALHKFGIVREVRGKGVLLGVEFSQPGLGRALKRTALENGVILRVDPDWFAVCPPLIAEESDLDELCALIDLSVEQALKR